MVGTFKQFSNTLWKLVLPAFPGCCLQPIACPALAASCPKEAAAENCIQRPRKGHSSLLSYKPPNRLFVTSYWPKLYHYILYAKKKKKKISGRTVQLVLMIWVVLGQKESKPVLKHVATQHLNRS